MRSIAISILFLLFCAQVWGEEVKPPSDDLNVTRDEVNRWQEQADAGEANAKYWLGKAYFFGWQLEPDPEKAVALFKESAEGGDAQGMNAFGYCYQQGIGMQQDYNQALEWLQKAVDAGSPEGMNNLANHYASGWGVEADKSRAMELYKQSAEAGSTKGMYNLGRCYFLGEGVEKSRVLAFQWLERAANENEIDALLLLGWELAFGDQDKELDKAREYYIRAADLGSTEAMLLLGSIASRQEDEKLAADWFRKAAVKGNPDGEFFYGAALLFGEGVKKDRAAALEWLNKAASRGHLNAKELLESEERKSKPEAD